MKNSGTFRRILCDQQSPDGLIFEHLVVNILKANQVLAEPGLGVYQLEDGMQIEFYRKGSFPPEGIFDQGHMVMGFKVPNVDIAAQAFIADGAFLLNNIFRPYPTYAYCYLLLKNGQVVGLFEETT